MTDFDIKALAVAASLPQPFTCTELGETLFDSGDKHARTRQCYARPAGKVLKRLRLANYVAETTRPFGDGRIKTCYCVTRTPS